MEPANITRRQLFSRQRRWVLLALFFSVFLLLCAGAISFPYLFETQTLWYKFGTDKTVLRIGQIAGMLALLLIFLQPLLAMRIRLWDRIVGLGNLYNLHRLNGILIVVLALCHILLVQLPEGMTNLPIGKKYWPEMVGMVLFLLLFSLICSAFFRTSLRLPYHRWHLMHRLAGYLIAITALIHVLFVSDAFKQFPPRLMLVLAATTVLLTFCWTKGRSLLQRQKPWQIQTVEQLNGSICRLRLQKPPATPFGYAPGQFVFLSLQGSGVTTEPHPFTLSSAPGSDDQIECTIKNCGDWTATVPQLSREGSARIDGPYGILSYTTADVSHELILIGGGIGITPLLSMLRALAQQQSSRTILLIWSNRTREDMVLSEELEQLQQALPNLQTQLHFSRESGKRLTKELLQTLLTGWNRDAEVYLCGPVPMMESVRRALLSLSFKRSRIHWEKFSL